MSWKTWVLASLLALSTLLTLLSAFGVSIMKDTYQRLHYSSIIVGLSFPLLVIAIWIETQSTQARLKGCLLVIMLFITNGILNHAIARAYRIRSCRHWSLKSDDHNIVRGDAGK